VKAIPQPDEVWTADFGYEGKVRSALLPFSFAPGLAEGASGFLPGIHCQATVQHRDVEARKRTAFFGGSAVS